MVTEKEKLEQDLKILAAMAAEMDDYLINKALFRQMAPSGMPRMTLGGYLMRRQRLLALKERLLDQNEQAQLDQAVSKADQAIKARNTFFVQKAHQELKSRLRQWDEYLKDLGRGEAARAPSYYRSAVETRAMITALVNMVQETANKLEADIPQTINTLDQTLHQRWKPGEFIWPEAWQPAYPERTYWWLYGRPG